MTTDSKGKQIMTLTLKEKIEKLEENLEQTRESGQISLNMTPSFTAFYHSD